MLSDAEKLYQEIVMRHSRAPDHLHALPNADAQSDGENPLCGDRVTVQIIYTNDGRIQDCAFDAKACAITVASADMMAAAVRGCSADEAQALFGAINDLVHTGTSTTLPPQHAELKALSGVHEFPSRIKCATLPWATLTAALANQPHASESVNS